MPNGPFDWLWSLLSPSGSKDNPIPLPPVQVVAGKGPDGQMTYPMRQVLDNNFTRDTLFKLIGGPPQRTEYRDKPQWPYASNTLGATEGPGNNSNLVLYGQLFGKNAEVAPQTIVNHEGGHIFSARDIDPGVIRAVKAQWTPEVAQTWSHNGSNSEEMFAFAFERAVNFLREVPVDAQFRATKNRAARAAELRAINRDYSPPGTDLLVNYLLKTPIYARHPLNQLQQRPSPARRAVKVAN